MATTKLTPDMRDRFLDLASALSPENLHWDGERSRTAAKKAERALKAKWRKLEKELGRKVDESEVWAAYLARDGATPEVR